MTEESTAGDISSLQARLDKIASAVTTLASAQRKSDTQRIQDEVERYEKKVTEDYDRAVAAIDDAEKATAAAYENGDAAEIARANRRMTEAVADRESAKLALNEFKAAKAEAERRDKGSSGAPTMNAGAQNDAKDTRRLNDWKSRNKEWYGVDETMTTAARNFSRQIANAGVISVGSDEYFREIDRKMRAAYPDKIRSAPETSGGGTTPGRGSSSGADSGRIPKAVLDGWRKMGINVDDDKVLSKVIDSRKALVGKGILPTEAQYGEING